MQLSREQVRRLDAIVGVAAEMDEHGEVTLNICANDADFKAIREVVPDFPVRPMELEHAS